MYSPQLGRFMQRDPLGYAAGLNLYAYAGGDPVNARDPSGLTTMCIGGALFRIEPKPTNMLDDNSLALLKVETSRDETPCYELPTAVGGPSSAPNPNQGGAGNSGGLGAAPIKGAICSATGKGVITGAVSGAVFGGVIGMGSPQGAVGGAAVGALGGAAVGWARQKLPGNSLQGMFAVFSVGTVLAGQPIGGVFEVVNVGVDGYGDPYRRTIAASLMGGLFESFRGAAMGRGAFAGAMANVANEAAGSYMDAKCKVR
jgi:hypothetical protein